MLTDLEIKPIDYRLLKLGAKINRKTFYFQNWTMPVISGLELFNAHFLVLSRV